MGKIADTVNSMQVEHFYGLTVFEQYILNKKIKLAVTRIIKEDLGYSLDVEIAAQDIISLSFKEKEEYISIIINDCGVTDEVDLIFTEMKKLKDRITLLETSIGAFEKNNKRRL